MKLHLTMRSLLAVCFALLLTAAATACSTTGGGAAQRVADGVDRICTMDDVDRLAMRARIDSLTDPHTVRVDCADPAPDDGAG